MGLNLKKGTLPKRAKPFDLFDSFDFTILLGGSGSEILGGTPKFQDLTLLRKRFFSQAGFGTRKRER
jgi:hypothetical protein